MQKKLLLMLFICLVFPGLPGFAGNARDSGTELITIRYAFWGDPIDIGVEQEILDSFHLSYPTIKVIPVVFPYQEYHQRILAMIHSGNPPDIMRLKADYFDDFIRLQALYNITGLITQHGIELDRYYSAGLEACRYKNSFYGLPWDVQPVFLFCNSLKFQKLGIPLPGPGWNWSDFLALCKIFNTGSHTEQQYGFMEKFTAQADSILPWVWGNGSDIFSLNGKKFTLTETAAVTAVQELADLIRQDTFPDPAVFINTEEVTQWFLDGRTVMMTGTPELILELNQSGGPAFEVLSLPAGPLEKRTTPVKSDLVGMSRLTSQPEAAWTLLAFMRAPDGPGEKLYVAAGEIAPSCDDAALWDSYIGTAQYPGNTALAARQAAGGQGHPFPLHPGWKEIDEVLILQLERIFSGQISAESAMEEIAPFIQEIMDRTAG